MATPLIPQEIYLLERYSSVEYFGQMRDAFAEMVKAAEDALADLMARLPPDYRKRPLWQQHDVSWGDVVLPNFRSTLQTLNEAYIRLTHGDASAIGYAGNLLTAWARQSRDYPSDWLPEPYGSRFGDAQGEATQLASNIDFTSYAGWNPGALSSRYDTPSRGPLDAPAEWPQYRLNPAVRVATDEPIKRTGIYLPDAEDSCAAFLYEGYGGAPQATTGYNPQTMQNVGLADTTWTLVERVADTGGGIPGEQDPVKAGVRLRCEANKPCPREGWWFTPAKQGSRRFFQHGELMPEFKTDWGITIWQWDERQSD
jgi:hypothetical protein